MLTAQAPDGPTGGLGTPKGAERPVYGPMLACCARSSHDHAKSLGAIWRKPAPLRTHSVCPPTFCAFGGTHPTTIVVDGSAIACSDRYPSTTPAGGSAGAEPYGGRERGQPGAGCYSACKKRRKNPALCVFVAPPTVGADRRGFRLRPMANALRRSIASPHARAPPAPSLDPREAGAQIKSDTVQNQAVTRDQPANIGSRGRHRPFTPSHYPTAQAVKRPCGRSRLTARP